MKLTNKQNTKEKKTINKKNIHFGCLRGHDQHSIVVELDLCLCVCLEVF